MDFVANAVITLGWLALVMAFLATIELATRAIERSMRHIDVRPVTIRIKR